VVEPSPDSRYIGRAESYRGEILRVAKVFIIGKQNAVAVVWCQVVALHPAVQLGHRLACSVKQRLSHRRKADEQIPQFE
jgi:hypothetical protein